MMMPSLQARRQKVTRELEQVNRQIAATEKRLVQIAARRAVLAQGKPKVAA